MTAGVPDPAASRAVLVGASRFDDLAALPAVRRNVAALGDVLTAPRVWGLADDHCVRIHEPESAREVSNALKQAAREAEDTLLFYYAGHGLIDPGTGELHLALRDSRRHEVYDTAVPYDWIRRALLGSRAARRIVVLDCCYSGRVLGAMSEGLDLAEIDGTYLLAAAAENAVALAPPDELYTAFTGELVGVLHDGIPEAGETLTLTEVFDAVRSSLAAALRPTPQCRDRNALGAVPFVHNPAHVPGRTAAPTDPGSREAAARRWMADVSHELRTPLTALTAVADVWEEEHRGTLPEAHANLVFGEVRRMNDLVETMMEIVRFDAGTARLVEEDVDVADVLTRCLEARDWSPAVTLDAPAPLPARLDPRRLDVITTNLVTNGLTHGRPPVHVAARAHPVRDELTIEVTDSGKGIPDHALPRVFDRFYKADNRRPRSTGAGLGLSLARENAHLMGGTLTAMNTPRGGARFTLRLPLRRGEWPSPAQSQ